MNQRIGSVVTDRPLVLTFDDNGRRKGAIVGEGFWQWRLNEFSETERTEAFDEVFAKLLQYLSTREDKRRFRSFVRVDRDLLFFNDSAPLSDRVYK